MDKRHISKYKLVFIGDQNVGKTGIVMRFMYDKFDDNYQATIGIDFLSKTMYLDDRTVRLQLWDTAGQERFRSLIPAYIRDSAVAVCVYDITDRKSFNSTKHWIDEVRAERGDDVVVVIVANKSDLGSERVVSLEEGQSKAQELKALFIETSAKSGLNIKALFKRIVQTLVELEGDKGGGQAGSQGDAGAATVITASQLSTAPAQGSRGSSCCS